MKTLPDIATEYAEARATSVDPVHARRAFMAGALAALDLERSGRARDDLIAECVQFGRAIGTAAEKA